MPDASAEFFDCLHPTTASWFRERFEKPTEAQELCVPRIVSGESVLLSSPTGSGKTLAGFLGILDQLLREHESEGQLPRHAIRAIYVSPLRALAYDIEKNLREPLRGLGLEDIVRVGLRTGDTSAAERQKQRRQPPHILVTTPESLAIVLPQKGWREALAGCRFVIIDELHAFAENKRGAHLAVSLERLEHLIGPERSLCRIGLSATVAPLDEVGRFLMGTGRDCHLAEAQMARESIVEVMTPLRKDPYPPAGYTATRMIRDMAQVVDRNQATLIFTNTRSGAERIAHRLKLALPEIAEKIECHHSSLDRDVRLEVEDRLKDGDLRAVVCSTSLELGLDIGHIDTVILVSTPKGVSRTLQRVGRSGHSIHQRSHGILVATNINDLIECVVCAEMTKQGQLDEVTLFENATDVIAQHVVGMAMDDGVSADEAFAVITSAYPFRTLERAAFDRIVEYLEGGGRSLAGQYRETFGKIEEKDGLYVTPSKKVERDYLMNVGTIHADGMVNVILNRRRLGSVEENFVKGLKVGDIFVLGGKTVKLVEAGVAEVIVENAAGRLPTVPTWNAHKIPLGSGLAREVASLRTEIERRLVAERRETDEVADWLVERWSISQVNATAIVEHFENQRLLSEIPTANRLLVEAFRNEQEDPDRVHYFFHTLIGRSANDALSRILSHRVKEAVGGNALVTIDDYGFLLSLKSFQEMGLAEWRELFHRENAEADLRTALEGSQLVKWQFGGIAQTGLMVPRNLPGEARKLKQIRWSSDILFKVLSQHEPDHPLLEQAIREATHTFLDLDRACAFLDTVPKLEWRFVEVPAVSPFAFGIYASKIREAMMMESPEEAIERLYRAMREKLGKPVE
ncbi:MAG: DEAD/DEAH box helicase [Verrucomicrobiae bacterium]|nr:DEAD/DEAH box helicase [Verrucomicrobiae bacterium]